MELNGPANIKMLLDMAENNNICPELKQKILKQVDILVLYMREYDKNSQIKWHEMIERYKNGTYSK